MGNKSDRKKVDTSVECESDLCGGGAAPMSGRQRAPVVAGARRRAVTQGGQGAAPCPPRARAEPIHLRGILL